MRRTRLPDADLSLTGADSLGVQPQRPGTMPELSRFFGIVIRMYYLDHDPPHFHASYGGSEALVRIRPFSVIAGAVPTRVLALVREWATLNEDALLDNWRRLRTDQTLLPIAPLE